MTAKQKEIDAELLRLMKKAAKHIGKTLGTENPSEWDKDYVNRGTQQIKDCYDTMLEGIYLDSELKFINLERELLCK